MPTSDFSACLGLPQWATLPLRSPAMHWAEESMFAFVIPQLNTQIRQQALHGFRAMGSVQILWNSYCKRILVGFWLGFCRIFHEPVVLWIHLVPLNVTLVAASSRTCFLRVDLYLFVARACMEHLPHFLVLTLLVCVWTCFRHTKLKGLDFQTSKLTKVSSMLIVSTFAIHVLKIYALTGEMATPPCRSALLWFEESCLAICLLPLVWSSPTSLTALPPSPRQGVKQ